MSTATAATARPRSKSLPRLGFLGVGWIGRNRMEAIAQADCACLAAVADPAEEFCESAAELEPRICRSSSLDELLEQDLDGVVIATPSALHAEQAIRALEAGCAVFCQKPLGRYAEEVRRVVEAARRADRLLGVDLSYRHVRGVREIRRLIAEGAIGEVYAADLVFHNAYGPDKAWYRDARLSGGGCVMDLGIHLVDLAMWALGGREVEGVTSRLYAGGRPVQQGRDEVETYGTARLDLSGGVSANVACSWYLPAGRDAVIRGTFYGTEGGLEFHNLGGSFYDFRTVRFHGTQTEVIDEIDNEWGGRAAVEWARRLAADLSFDAEIEKSVEVAKALDLIYANAAGAPDARDAAGRRSAAGGAMRADDGEGS